MSNAAARRRDSNSMVHEPSRAKRAGGLLSKVTARWQTTLPSGVRKALDLDAGSQIRYEVQGDSVVIRKAVGSSEDPVVEAFLAFVERDMLEHPQSLTPVTEAFASRLRKLTQGVEVGSDERIEGPVAL